MKYNHDEIADAYVNMLTEAKNENSDQKKGTVNGAVPVGKGITGDATVPQTKQGGSDEAKKDLPQKTPTEGKSDPNAKKGKKIETVGEVHKESKDMIKSSFDILFGKVIGEANDPLDQVPELANDETGETGSEIDTEIDPDMSDEIEDETEDVEMGLIERIKALRDELDAIIDEFSAEEEAEAGDEELGDEELGDETAEDLGSEVADGDLARESVEYNGKPTPLNKSAGMNLQKGTTAPGKLAKAKRNKAVLPSGTKPCPRPNNLGNRKVPDWKGASQGPMGTRGAEFIQ